MELLLLTKTGGILGPFATVLGWIINYIYIFLEKIGIPNIGLAIILFTLFVNLVLLPLTLKQQKSTKLSAVVNPEIQKIQAKYKGKKDELSMRRMQAETQAVYQKYGTSMTGGCLWVLIQMPILFALYHVIYHIPAYIEPVYELYQQIAEPMLSSPDGMATANALISDLGIRMVTEFDQTTFTIPKIIDMLYYVKSTGWDAVAQAFSGTPAVADAINTVVPQLKEINWFIGGLDIADTPMANGWWPGIMIPLLSGFTQWLSVKISTAQTQSQMNNNNQDNPMNGSMKMMNTIMPLFSVFICFSIQTGLGLYWIASAVFRTIISVIANKILDKKGIDAIIAESQAKAKKKAEKRGDKPSKFEEYAKQSTRNIEAAELAAKKRKSISELANTSVAGSSSNSDSSSDNDVKKSKANNYTAATKDKDSGSKGSIAAYANMLKKKD